MKEKSNADKNTDTDAKVKINTNAFIRQVSVAGSNANMQQANDAPMQTEEVNEMNEERPKESQLLKKKKGQNLSFDYESTFLNRNELKNRQGLYIDKENYEVLQTLVRSIRTERLSVSGLVDNIINHHIELYGDEINRIYEENITKPIKK